MTASSLLCVAMMLLTSPRFRWMALLVWRQQNNNMADDAMGVWQPSRERKCAN